MTRLRFLIFLLPFAALLIAEFVLYNRMFPVSTGTPQDLWAHAAGINPTPQISYREPLPLLLQGGDYFYISDTRSLTTDRVSKKEIDEAFPELLKKVSTEASNPNCPHARAYRTFLAIPNPANRTVLALNQCLLDEATQDKPGYAAKDSYFMLASNELRFAAHKARYYWRTCLIEILWLAAVPFLLSYPLMSRFRLARYLICWNIAPIVLFIPQWFGFSCQIILNISGETRFGGIVYPYLFECLPHLSVQDWEIQFQQYLPQILAPYSQWIYPSFFSVHPDFNPIHLTHGPLTALAYAIPLFNLALLIHATRLLIHRKSSNPGFPVHALTPLPSDADRTNTPPPKQHPHRANHPLPSLPPENSAAPPANPR